MTREHKLSLILGFSVVLLVAVLISDHFSSASRHELARLDEGDPSWSSPERPLVEDAPIATPTVVMTAPDLGVASEPESPMGAPGWGASPEPSEPTRLVINQGSGAVPIEGTGPGLLERGQGALAAVPDALDELRRRFQEEGIRYVEEAPVAASVRVVPQESETATPRVRLPESASRAEPAPREAERRHAVASGESLFEIAARYYGDGNLWRPLAAYNGNRVAENGAVRSGVTLRIPSREVLTGERSAATPAATPERAPERARPAARATRTYIVKKGDMLSLICARELGSSKRMGEVLALNPSLKDANSIRVGMELVLPAE